MPQSAKYASSAASLPASAPVCELAERRAAELVGDDGLAGGMRRARRRGELCRGAHRFQEQQDHARCAVGGEQLDQLAYAHVGLVAHRDQLGEAKAARRTAREQRAEHGAALRDDAGAARRQRRHFQHRVHAEGQLPGNVDHAHAVRPEQAHAERTRTLHQPRLAPHALFARVGEPAAEDAGDRNAGLAAVLERLLDIFDEDVSMIDLLRQVAHPRPGLLPQHFLAHRIHREHLPGVAVLLQVALRAGGVLRRISRRTDQGNRSWGEQGLRETHRFFFAPL